MSKFNSATPIPKLTRKKIIIGFVVLIVVVALIGAFVLTWRVLDKKVNNQEVTKSTVVHLENRPIPDTKDEQLIYYTQIGEGYLLAENYQKALEAMLKADSLITDRTIGTGTSANNGIARCYRALGNTVKAREYYQKEIDRLKISPENAETVKYLMDLRDNR